MEPEEDFEDQDPSDVDASVCYAVEDRPWWKRVVARLFSWHGLLPDLPEWAKDGIVIETRVNFSFVDRVRILLTGNLSVKTWTACEHRPGRVETQSSAKPMPPDWVV